MLQEAAAQAELTVAEILTCTAATTRAAPVGELVELVGLDGRRTRASGRSRAASGAGSTSRSRLVGDPDLLFLDEPTTGFDPSARRQAWSTIKDLCALGKTVFLTTHFMDEAQALADRVAVMVDGRIVALGTPRRSAAATPRRPRSRSPCPPASASPTSRRSTARGSPRRPRAGCA